MENKNPSPDMVKYHDVIAILTSDSSYYKNEKAMATIIRQINGLQKYDYHPVSDTINNTTVNVIAETSKVRDCIEKLGNSFR